MPWRKAPPQLKDRAILSGWLHRTAQNIASQTVRTIERRRAREQQAVVMNELLAGEAESPWSNIAPHLDAALGQLSEPDRDALLLRYFERKSARDMALTLGISDEAAQKRVNRAVERLRELFIKRGVTVGASGLAVVISTNAVQAAPAGLHLAISSAAALTGTTLASSATITAAKTIAMTSFQKTITAAVIAILCRRGTLRNPPGLAPARSSPNRPTTARRADWANRTARAGSQRQGAATFSTARGKRAL